MKKSNRLISLLLAVAMAFSFLPTIVPTVAQAALADTPAGVRNHLPSTAKDVVYLSDMEWEYSINYQDKEAIRNGAWSSGGKIVMGLAENNGGTVFEKGLGVMPKGTSATDASHTVFDLADNDYKQNFFYAAAGITNGTAQGGTIANGLVFEVWGSYDKAEEDYTQAEYTLLERSGDPAKGTHVKGSYVYQFHLDVTGVRYLKLVVYAVGGVGYMNCNWAGVCVYNNPGYFPKSDLMGLNNGKDNSTYVPSGTDRFNTYHFEDLPSDAVLLTGSDYKDPETYKGTSKVVDFKSASTHLGNPGHWLGGVADRLDTAVTPNLKDGIVLKDASKFLRFNCRQPASSSNQTDGWVTFDISDLDVNRFYTVIGSGNGTAKHTAYGPANGIYGGVKCQVWGAETVDGEYTLLSESEPILLSQTGEFLVDITGVNYLKLRIQAKDTRIINGLDTLFYMPCVFKDVETGIIVSAPTKTEYLLGEELDTTGMVVTVDYSGDTDTVITEGYEVTGFDAETIGTKTITVTYGEFTDTFEVVVKEETGITITAPTKVEYFVGEELDTTGLTVTVHYSNDTSAVLTEGYTLEGFEAETVGTKTITVTYGEFTDTFDVTVKEETGIAITAPNKVEYFVGEELDTTGLTVTVHYSNDTSAVLTEGYTVEGFDSETAGTKTVTVTYGAFTATFEVEIKEIPVVVTGITITAPTKIEYLIGEELDLSGLVVDVSYDNNTTEVITEGFTVTGFDSETVGTKTITVTYGEFTATFDITVKKPEITVDLNLSVTVAANGVTVSWTEAETDAYVIYRRVSGTEAWEQIAEVTELTYLDKQAVSGTKYDYAVSAKFGEDLSRKNTATVTYVAMPTNFVVENKAGGIKVSWNAVEGATTYVYAYSTFKNGEWSAETKTTITANNYLVSGLTNGTLYRFRVYARKSSVQSISSDYVEIRRLTGTVVTGTNEATGIKLSWTPNKYAAQQTLYRSEKIDGVWTGWSRYKELDAGVSSYVDTEVENNVLYRYSVRATTEDGYRSCYREVVILRLERVNNIQLQNKAGEITVTWDANPAATVYKIYRRAYKDGAWTAFVYQNSVTQKQGTSYSDNLNIEFGVTYQYRVLAVQSIYRGGSRASGELMRLKRTILTNVTAKTSGISFNIQANEFATSYEIQRCTVTDGVAGAWEVIVEDTTELTYLDTTVEPGVTYKYRAIAKNGTSRSPSVASAEVTARNKVYVAESHEVIVTDIANGRIVVTDLDQDDPFATKNLTWEWHPTTALGWGDVTQERLSESVSDVKYRWSEFHKTNVVLFCTSRGVAGMIEYPSGKCLWKTTVTGVSPHAVELLPNGDIVVASSGGGDWAKGEIHYYQLANNGTYTMVYECALNGAHGLLWDPDNEVIWALGFPVLEAYTPVKGSDGKVTLQRVEGLGCQVPDATGHDLTPVYGNKDLMWFTDNVSIQQYSKSQNKVLEKFENSGQLKPVSTVKGVTNFVDGVVVCVSYSDRSSGESHPHIVRMYRPQENGSYTLVKVENANFGFNKVRAFTTDYM